MDGNYWEHSRAERMNSQGRQRASGGRIRRGSKVLTLILLMGFHFHSMSSILPLLGIGR
jgi:hypothetical protein